MRYDVRYSSTSNLPEVDTYLEVRAIAGDSDIAGRLHVDFDECLKEQGRDGIDAFVGNFEVEEGYRGYGVGARLVELAFREVAKTGTIASIRSCISNERTLHLLHKWSAIVARSRVQVFKEDEYGLLVPIAFDEACRVLGTERETNVASGARYDDELPLETMEFEFILP
jgi:GNAT superfamily N-acetyltransferase